MFQPTVAQILALLVSRFLAILARDYTPAAGALPDLWSTTPL